MSLPHIAYDKSRLRELLLECNNLTRPDASAVYCQGRTVLQAAINGPADVSNLAENAEKALFTCTLRRRTSCKDDGKLREMEHFIGHTLESIVLTSLYARTSIHVMLQELQLDGPLLAPALNAACCALLESGLAMRAMAAAIAIGLTSDGQLLIDTNEQQAMQCSALITMVFESRRCELLGMTQDGKFSIKQLPKLLQLGQAAARQMFEFYAKSIRKRFTGQEFNDDNMMRSSSAAAENDVHQC